MRIYLTSLKVLTFEKDDVAQFLNGLTSNVMDAPRNAFLTIHGRIVATCIQVSQSASCYALFVEQVYVDSLLAHLQRYIALGGVQVTVQDWKVYCDLDGDSAIEGAVSIPLGEGKLIGTDQEIQETIGLEEFTLYRVQNHWPQQGLDYTDEMLLNVDMQEHVSFTKGCFLGQEPISKVYNRSKPTWRLVVKSLASCDEDEGKKMTSRVVDPSDGQEYGFVFEKND